MIDPEARRYSCVQFTASRVAARMFRLALTPSAPLEPGEYVLRAGARSGAGGSLPSRETARLTIASGASLRISAFRVVP